MTVPGRGWRLAGNGRDHPQPLIRRAAPVPRILSPLFGGLRAETRRLVKVSTGMSSAIHNKDYVFDWKKESAREIRKEEEISFDFMSIISFSHILYTAMQKGLENDMTMDDIFAAQHITGEIEKIARRIEKDFENIFSLGGYRHASDAAKEINERQARESSSVKTDASQGKPAASGKANSSNPSRSGRSPAPPIR
ncbi:hypothetical protein [Methylobacterium sp. SyP6R]|uniref:hypothetical protein n=1 Tax=Methylobacterium sp. SyP6R TaxID=2718876 RepID=UPI001F45B2CC|nr:hypothetical protein [Methylobacterium sp. SyP6R]MCF4130257.1 hypothetical protein [Methylobacterium sp. SyP6R]